MPKFELKGSQNINDLYSNISQYFEDSLLDIDEDSNAFLRNDCSELIGELEGLIQRLENRKY